MRGSLAVTGGSEIRLELVICTRNGGDRLRRCLRAIASSDHDALHALKVVDNGSDDGVSAELARDFVSEFGSRASFLVERGKGNGVGRNAALRCHQGSHLLFIDDDCYVAPDFFSKWTMALSEHQVDFGGATILPFDEDKRQGCFQAGEPILRAAGAWIERGFIQGSNMFFSSKCLAKVGFFDVRFGAGTRYAGEEWDLAVRASLAGFTGAYLDGPIVYHDHGRDRSSRVERLRFYDYGAGAVYAKHLTSGNRRLALAALHRDLLSINRRRKVDLARGFIAFSLRRHG